MTTNDTTTAAQALNTYISSVFEESGHDAAEALVFNRETAMILADPDKTNHDELAEELGVSVEALVEALTELLT